MKRRLAVRLVALLLLPAALAWAGPATPDSLDLVVLHVNDTHGRLLPVRASDGGSEGGIARLATLVKRIRAENEGRILVLHAGDILSRGGPLTVHYGGEADFLAMDAIGFDAVCPGNGEYYFGLENLMRQASLVRFPVLLSNIFYRHSGGSIFPPYEIRELAGLKVAILGLGVIHEERPESGPLVLRDPIAVAKVHAPILRQQADLLIALTHIGVRGDSLLAIQVPQIDLIVGGHSHTRLDLLTRIPRVAGGGEVVVAQAGDLGRFLGRVRVPMRREGGRYRAGRIEGELLPVDEKVDEEPEIAGLLNRYAAPLEAQVCTSEIRVAHPDSGDSPMGHLVAEALRSGVGTDVALLTRSTVRGGMEIGPVTVADICRVHPWRSRVLRLSLTGSQILQALAERDILTSGCRFRRTVEGIEGLEINGSVVDTARSYSVATDEFYVYRSSFLKDVPFDETGHRVDRLLYRHLRRLSVIRGMAPPDRSKE